MGKLFRNIVFGFACAAIGFAAALPLVIWGSGKYPEFYGAFTAAIIAAAALIFGSFYQDSLTREREGLLLQQAKIAEAIDEPNDLLANCRIEPSQSQGEKRSCSF